MKTKNDGSKMVNTNSCENEEGNDEQVIRSTSVFT